jgi:2-oxoglutarate ferredoxin oxidoreductase subunit alpha
MDSFARYLDVDGDGICYRTLPGEHPKGAYLIRGSGHNKFGGYTEKADEYQEVVDRLRRKFDTATGLVPEPVIESGERADCAIVSSGSCDGAVREARDKLAAEGIHADYMRIRAFPFSPSVAKFLSRYERVFVVEQNRDAQLRSLLQTETGVAGDKLIPVLSYGGMPIACTDIIEPMSEKIAKGKAA